VPTLPSSQCPQKKRELNWIPLIRNWIKNAIENALRDRLVYPGRIKFHVPFPGRKIDLRIINAVAPPTTTPPPPPSEGAEVAAKKFVVQRFVDELLNGSNSHGRTTSYSMPLSNRHINSFITSYLSLGWTVHSRLYHIWGRLRKPSSKRLRSGRGMVTRDAGGFPGYAFLYTGCQGGRLQRHFTMEREGYQREWIFGLRGFRGGDAVSWGDCKLYQTRKREDRIAVALL